MIAAFLVAVIVILSAQIRGLKSDGASATDASSTDGVSGTYEIKSRDGISETHEIKPTDGVSEMYEIESTEEKKSTPDEREVVIPYSDDIHSGVQDTEEKRTETETTEQKKEAQTTEKSTTASEKQDSEQASTVITTEEVSPDRYELPVVPAE